MKSLAIPFLCLTLAGFAAYASSLSGCGNAVEEGMVTPPDMTMFSAYSCDMQTRMPPQCKEFTEISASQPMSGLESLCGNTLTPGPCTRVKSYGGCRTKNASYTFTTWFYAGGTMFTTMAQVQAYCGSAYVPPT